METKRVRNPALDVVRIVALFMVVSVHFFLNSGYYNVVIEGEKLFLMTLLRTFCKASVALFILLTGYLMNKKQLTGRYYLGIVKTLGIYVLACIACRMYEVHQAQGVFELKPFILGVLDFSAASYSWYVEMYICLFLLIPFLNVMYHGMGTPKRKLILVASFFLVSSAYTAFNIFDLHTPGWWSDTTLSNTYDEVVPDYLKDIYPIAIYLMGCALSDLKVKMKRIPNLLLLAAVTLGIGGYSYYRCIGRKFIWGHWQGDRAVFIVAIAVLVFIFISGFDMTRIPKWLARFLKLVSDSVLGAYLVSYIFDKIFYAELNAAIPEVYNRYPYYFVIVPLVFVCSILLSMLMNLIWWLISAPVGLVFSKVGALISGRKSSDTADITEQEKSVAEE